MGKGRDGVFEWGRCGGQRIWRDSRLVMDGGKRANCRGFGKTVGQGIVFPNNSHRPRGSQMSVRFYLYKQCETFNVLHAAGRVGYRSSRIVSCYNPFLVSSFFTSGGVKE